jgi:outer membrane protein
VSDPSRFARTNHIPIMRRLPLAVLVLACAPWLATAQATPTVISLSLDQAIQTAQQNNPQYLTAVDTRDVAGSQLRSAYGAFLPSVSAQFGSQYREGLQQLIAGQRFGAASDQISSTYDITVQAQYNAAGAIAPKLERANVRAADAAVAGSAQRLRTAITQQYLNALQQAARAAMQDTLLTAARAQFALAEARAAAGAVTALDVKRAEVAVGQQEVALLQAENQAKIEELRLFQQMGVRRPDSVQLTTTFTLETPPLQLDQLIAMGRNANPTLNELRMREQAAQLGYRSAQSQYTPTLSLFTGVGGYTNQYTDRDFVLRQRTQSKQNLCLNQAGNDPAAIDACNGLTLTPQETSAAIADNAQFPFRFQREQRVQEAAAARNAVRYNVHAQELQLEADITAAWLNLDAARRTVAIQERNAAAARDAEFYASERYKVGLNTFVDVAQSRADRETAENGRISAIYEYHRAFALLEDAVGRTLR